MKIQLVNTLYDNGSLSQMYKAGFITAKVFEYREIYVWIHTQMRIHGICKSKAVFEAQGKFQKDERTIWRALNCFSDSDSTEHQADALTPPVKAD